MIAILLLVFSVLGVVVTDESTQYATLRAAGAITRKSRSEEAIFLRGRITGFLASNEGLHFSAIADAFDMGNNQAAHHLSILEKEQYIWSKRDGRKLRFYTTAINSHSRDGLPRPADLPSAESVPARILSDIEAQEQGFLVGASQRQIAGRVGASQQLISHHLKSLERLGWVIRTGRGRRKSLRLTLAGAAALDRIRCDDEIPVTMTDVSLMDRITL
jgi:predicted transcriptional regulator